MAGPIRRGQVRWYRFATPDKRRPVVVLSEADGIPKPSAINCDHIQTVAKGKIGPIITTLSPEKLTQLRTTITFALDL